MENSTASATLTVASPLRRRTKRGEAARRQILGAAIACLNELGYAGTSIEAVMARAGISRGSVLNQFPTRIDLMVATSDAAMQAMIADTRTRMDAIADPVARYRAMFDVTWAGQKMPEGTAVTEILLAARRDSALAAAFLPVASRIEQEIDQYTAERAREAGVREADIDTCLVHGRILILSLRGITLELTFDPDRAMINRALAQIKAQHVAHCDRVLSGR
ncbi:MAG: TetR/AcrR family transcriptional regulator [Acidobacteria bacterium]|jgi:AcrR family transcriptional regulator|nr:TetR/AcrR family transcriptional regulator [Acidobacteriota bacterium]